MRVVYIAAGAGSGHCGACARDAGLVRALIGCGHHVLMTPLYTPLAVEGADPSIDRVFYGGINAWLEQRFLFWRHRRPGGILDRLIDSPRLLRWVSGFAVETRAEKLGAMTQSVLEGENGPQAREVRKLLDFLQKQPSPDVIHLSNSLLSALAPVFRREFECPVVCNFQGEDLWMSGLIEPCRTRALELIRRNVQSVARLTVPYADCVSEAAAFFDVDRERIRVLPPCVDCHLFTPGTSFPGSSGPEDEPFRVGFLSRIVPEKGLDTLAEAVIQVGAVCRERVGKRVLLRVAGHIGSAHRRFYRRIAEMVKSAEGVDLEYVGQPDLEGKLAFLRGCDVFSVPSRVPERRGMAVLEAMSCGTPVVLPDHGVYIALIRKTGGGRLTRPGASGELARALLELAADSDAQRATAEAASRGTRAHFSTENAAAAYEQICAELMHSV
ncbi:MAG: glycosyltransferase family 4 protein [Kiritimatiellaeota bacterium]|nr:glycosyltransferase family 4 protein [Kiritimatiellota bacterium]